MPEMNVILRRGQLFDGMQHREKGLRLRGNLTRSLEDKFVSHWENSPFGDANPFEREYRFAALYVGLGPGVQQRLKAAGLRDWRFDLAFPGQQVACEINGGIYQKGRHLQPKGYMDDCQKLRDAAKLGWRVLPFPGPVLEENPDKCIQDLAVALGLPSIN